MQKHYFIGLIVVALMIFAESSLAVMPMVSPAPKSLLEKADLSIANYGAPHDTQTYLVGGLLDDNRWLISVGRYGGDGDDPGQIVLVFWVDKSDEFPKFDKLLQIPLEDVKVTAGEVGVSITGKHVISLCGGCDSWHAAPDDSYTYFIPLEIDVPGPSVTPLLTAAQAKKMLSQIEAKVKQDEPDSPTGFDHAALQRARDLLKGLTAHQ